MVKILSVKQLGKAQVIVDIVDKGNPEIRPGGEMNPTEIAIHNTGNSGRGADAKAHNTYIHNQSKLPVVKTGYASWHFSVDENFIYQHIPLDEPAWHTGDGSGTKSGNKNAIGIEICEHVDQKNYALAEENAIALTVHLMELIKIDLMKVKPHQAYSGKYCPRVILKRDGTFDKFHNRIKIAAQPKPVVKQSNTKPVESTWQILKVIGSEYGIYSIPKTKWKEDSAKYIGWIFVARKRQMIDGKWWFELFLGDDSYGWIGREQIESVPYKWAEIKDDTVSYIHSDLKVECGKLSKGGRVAVLLEENDKYLIVSSNRPQWIPKTLVEM